MPRAIRYHLDEHCDLAIAAGLRLRGIDVVTTPQAGLLSASDEDHLAFAVGEGRVVFTQDSDRSYAVGLHPVDFCPWKWMEIGSDMVALVSYFPQTTTR